MSEHSIENRMKMILAREAMVQMKPEEIDNNASLMDDLGLDSKKIVELIIGIENEFNIKIKDEDLSLDLFKSVISLSEYVRSKNRREWGRP